MSAPAGPGAALNAPAVEELISLLQAAYNAALADESDARSPESAYYAAGRRCAYRAALELTRATLAEQPAEGPATN